MACGSCAAAAARRQAAAAAAGRPVKPTSRPTGGTKTTVYKLTCGDGSTLEFTDPGAAALAAKNPERGGCTMVAERR